MGCGACRIRVTKRNGLRAVLKAMTTLRVLYIDDEADIRELAQFSLELDAELEVRTAASGAAALACLDEFRPDVILLDVMMPKMDGPEVLEVLRATPEHAATPVIFVTARAFSEERDRLMTLGAAGVITKPFDPISFAQNIRGILLAANG